MKKGLKILLWFGAVFIVGGIGGIVLSQEVLPKLAMKESIRHWPLVRNTQERTTIIERTEHVEITEDNAARRIATQVRSSAVMVIVQSDGKVRSGSGIFVTGDGVIAVSGNIFPDDVRDDIDVRAFLATGELLEVKDLVRDALTGIVLISVEKARDYPAVSFARTEDLFAGQNLVEIGVDLDVKDALYVATTQMQSFLATTKSGVTGAWEGYIQADTLERQMGSFLVTHRGELAAIAGSDGTRIEILPTAAVERALDRLIMGRSKETLDIGITYHSVIPTVLISDAYSGGVIIDHVVQGSRGALAGLRAGDHLTEIDGVAITPYRTVPLLFDERYDADRIELTILRSGVEKRVLLEKPRK